MCNFITQYNYNKFEIYINHNGSWSREVGIATGYGFDGSGVEVRVPVRARFFSSLRRPDRFWGHSVFYLMGIGSSFQGGKGAGP
jgi:hypothetical protein